MTEVFADTFYFVALLSPSDNAHQRARTITSNRHSKLVTTAWVLTELGNTLSNRETRGKFLTTFQSLRSNPMAVIIGPDDYWFTAGIELYASRADKDWSLTDCISFVVMRDRGISDALTGDHHFEQAGVRALLK